MAGELYIEYGTQLLFADHAGDFTGGQPATPANSLVLGTPTNVQFDLGSVAATNGGRQSAKVDLGALRGSYMLVRACIETALAPTDGQAFDFYWAGSPNATAGTGNPGNTTGADAAYTFSTGLLGQMDYIGSLIVSAATINKGKVGVFTPEDRYGMIVTINRTGQNVATVASEVHVTATPIVYVPGQ